VGEVDTGKAYHATKTLGKADVYVQSLLISALDGGRWSASRPGHLTRMENSPRM
jgi:hypothetical protein